MAEDPAEKWKSELEEAALQAVCDSDAFHQVVKRANAAGYHCRLVLAVSIVKFPDPPKVEPDVKPLVLGGEVRAGVFDGVDDRAFLKRNRIKP